MAGIETFKRNLRNVLDSIGEDMWAEKVFDLRGNVKGPELLSIKYNVTEWLSPTYKGNDDNKRAVPGIDTLGLPPSVRGLKRV